jgi:hypothetical protein
MRPRSHLFLLLAFLLSTLSRCNSSEESLIIDTLSSGRLEGPLSITSTDQPQPTPHRQLVNKEGDVSLLVVRVSGLDRSPSLDNAFLYKSIFVTEASLRWQFYKCSAGKLNIVPTKKGVLEVSVDMNINGANVADVVGATTSEGLAQLKGVTDFLEYADLTMLVVPQGTKWIGDPGWTAFAATGGGLSVMNDDKVKYPGLQMHELGHNFGLNHANGIDDPFGDWTSHMCQYIMADNFPHKCFNAQNHWLLGWFSDRSITVDPNVPVKVNILGFVDYTKAIPGSEFVVANVGANLYLQFNRAKLHNRDSEEARDKLVIILDRGAEGTTLVAELDNGTSLYTVPDFESSGRQLNVEVCRVSIGATDDNVDWMEVSIGYGASLCGGEPSPRPSPQPSPRPSPFPSPRPSRRPSPRPSPQPSSRPSPQPSPRPSPRPSARPSLKPAFNPSPQSSLRHTSKPTRQPSPEPSPRPSPEPSTQATLRPFVGSASTQQFVPSSPKPTTALFAQATSIFNGDNAQSGAAAGLGSLVMVYTMVAITTAVGTVGSSPYFLI